MSAGGPIIKSNTAAKRLCWTVFAIVWGGAILLWVVLFAFDDSAKDSALRTIEHDGHRFVASVDGLVHHPDCGCGK